MRILRVILIESMQSRLAGHDLEFPAAVGSAVAVRLRLLYVRSHEIMPAGLYWIKCTKPQDAPERFLAEMVLYKITLVW